jgi:hypothetical protein
MQAVRQENYMRPARGVQTASMSKKRRLANRVAEVEGTPEILSHRRSITDSAEETIPTVKMGFLVRDDNCNFVGCRQVRIPAAVLVSGESNRTLLALVFLKQLQSLLEDVTPTAIREDGYLHSILEGLVIVHGK